MKVLTSAGLGDVSEWMKLDMSMPQMKVLMLLNNHGTLKVSDIAEKMGVPRPIQQDCLTVLRNQVLSNAHILRRTAVQSLFS